MVLHIINYIDVNINKITKNKLKNMRIWKGFFIFGGFVFNPNIVKTPKTLQTLTQSKAKSENPIQLKIYSKS
jgi:hypothetical protein